MIEKIARRVMEKIALEESRMGQIASQQAIPSAGPGAGATSEAIGKAEPIAQAGPGIIRRGFNMATAPFRMAGRVATAPLRFAARHPFMAAGAGAAGLGVAGLGYGHLANMAKDRASITGDLANSAMNEGFGLSDKVMANMPQGAMSNPEVYMKHITDFFQNDPAAGKARELKGVSDELGKFMTSSPRTEQAIDTAGGIANLASERGGVLGRISGGLQAGAKSLFGPSSRYTRFLTI